MVLLNAPSMLTSLQLKAEEGLVSLEIWVRVKMALIFLARVENEGITCLLRLEKKCVFYRCSFAFVLCSHANEHPFLFSLSLFFF